MQTIRKTPSPHYLVSPLKPLFFRKLTVDTKNGTTLLIYINLVGRRCKIKLPIGTANPLHCLG